MRGRGYCVVRLSAVYPQSLGVVGGESVEVRLRETREQSAVTRTLGSVVWLWFG